jgi:hypothetical protein
MQSVFFAKIATFFRLNLGWADTNMFVSRIVPLENDLLRSIQGGGGDAPRSGW